MGLAPQQAPSPGRVDTFFPHPDFTRREALVGTDFGVELGDGAADAESPGEDGEGFELVGDDILIDGVGDRDAGFVHFFSLLAQIVKKIAEVLNAVLAAEGTVAGNEEGVFVPGGESF